MRKKQAERLSRSQRTTRKEISEAQPGCSAPRSAAALEFVGDLEFASRQIPRILALSGWLVHNSQRPLAWGLLTQGSYQDISSQVSAYFRSDLIGPESSANRIQVGFTAFLEIDDTSNDIQLAIGSVGCSTLVCLDVAAAKNSDLEAYFPNSHQLFRFGIARCIAMLSEDEAQVVSPVAHFALPSWIREIQFLQGALHQDVAAGIDHHICTASGHCYVEGWINPASGRNFTLAGCLVGTRSSGNLLYRSAFRRPDIAGSDEFPGFAFVGRGEVIPGAKPLLLVQSHFIDTGEIAYAKISLDQVDEQKFARTFWSRVLDIHTINRQALKQVLSFTRPTPALRPEPLAGRRSQGKAANRRAMAAIILQNSRGAALRNLFVLTARAGQFDFSDIILLSPDPAAGALWWPDAGEMRIVNPVQTLDEALDQIDAPLVLIVDATVMATDGFADDVKAAASLLDTRADLDCVVLAKKELLNGHRARDLTSIRVKIPGIEASAWLRLDKGTTHPPIVLRTGELRRFCRHAWPQPSPELALRSYLKGAAQETQWMESGNVEVFYARPSASYLPLEQADLLYQIDPQL
jgi:hypothetical protein